MASTSTLLPEPRLVTTGHSPDGTSVFTYDNTLTPFAPFGPAGPHFTSIHASPAVPASNTASFPDLSTTLPRCPPSGVLFCITDIPAGMSAPMHHRTQSIDYAVVVSGEIVLSLDNGEEKTVKAGEFMVQRGANHSWHNRTQETCRIAVVMVGAEKIVLQDGRVPMSIVRKSQILANIHEGIIRSDCIRSQFTIGEGSSDKIVNEPPMTNE